MKTFHAYTLTLFLGLFTCYAHGDTSVWKVSKGKDYFYIGGTIHLLNPEDYPLPSQFNQAYADADTLVFETDIDASNLPAEQAKMITAMTFNDGRELSNVLSDKTYKQLNKFLLARGIPIAQFEQFQPWGLSLILTIMEYERLGMMSELGVDQHFNDKAIEDNKGISNLETLDEQLNFLQSLAEIDPNVIIQYTLKDMSTFPQWISEMKNAWRTGHISAFSEMDPIMEMKTLFPKVYHALLTHRNNNWMKQIPSYANNNKIEFILVGTLHLNGEKGLLQQLENKGFKVEHL